MQLKDICLEVVDIVSGAKAAERSSLNKDPYSIFQGMIPKIVSEFGDVPIQDVVFTFLYVIIPAVLRSGVTLEKLRTVPCEYERGLIKEMFEKTIKEEGAFYFLNLIMRTLHKKRWGKMEVGEPSLELGMGDGVASEFILNRSATVGSEPILSYLLAAQKRERCKYYMSIDSTSIPFKDETFNSVFTINTIYHTENKDKAVSEMARVLRPGGLLFLDDVSPALFESILLPVMYKMISFETIRDDFTKHVLGAQGEGTFSGTLEYWHKNLAELGFDIIGIESYLSPELTTISHSWHFFEGLLNLTCPTQYLREGLKEYFLKFLHEVIAPLIAIDGDICKDRNGSYISVMARKTGEVKSQETDIMKQLICPECKEPFAKITGRFACLNCGLDYPVADSIPLLIPFYAKES